MAMCSAPGTILSRSTTLGFSTSLPSATQSMDWPSSWSDTLVDTTSPVARCIARCDGGGDLQSRESGETWACVSKRALPPRYAVFVRCLTIYHGTWPYCDREGWETHPLLFCGKERPGLHLQRGDAITETAYQDYARFVQAEENRGYHVDARTFSHILALLPGLQKLTLSHIYSLNWSPRSNAKYAALRKRIWLAPSFRDPIGPMVARVLPALHERENIMEVEINGSFDSCDIQDIRPVLHVKRLRIRGLLIYSGTQSQAIRFLSLFPNLEGLSIKMKSKGIYATILLDELLCPHLRRFEFLDFLTTESTLLNFIRRHLEINKVRFRNISLASGSWQSFLGTFEFRDQRFPSPSMVHLPEG